MGALMLVMWLRFAPDAPKSAVQNISDTHTPCEKKGTFLTFLSPMLLLIMLGIALQGMLRDGVTTWMPTYISDTYSLGGEISILSGVCLPIFSIVCIKITSFIYKRWVKNPLTLAAIIFAIGAASAFLLSLTNGHGALFSVILSALLTGSMYGVNLLLVCMLPGYFKSYSNVAFITGAINCATYVGSAASTFGFAVLSEELGWSFTILLWLAVAILGTLICLLTMNKFKNKCINNA
jgi:OPA family glycerol-3-phosphate transporter-like MFS transporter